MPDTNIIPPTPPGWLKLLLYASFAAIAGMLGYIMRNIDKGEQIRWVRVVVEGAAAGCVGVMVMLVCQAMSMSEQWTGVIVGVSGWLGANASIRMLESVVYKKLGVSAKEENHENPDKQSD